VRQPFKARSWAARGGGGVVGFGGGVGGVGQRGVGDEADCRGPLDRER
jgi:hypothetical protein